LSEELISDTASGLFEIIAGRCGAAGDIDRGRNEGEPGLGAQIGNELLVLRGLTAA